MLEGLYLLGAFMLGFAIRWRSDKAQLKHYMDQNKELMDRFMSKGLPEYIAHSGQSKNHPALRLPRTDEVEAIIEQERMRAN